MPEAPTARKHGQAKAHASTINLPRPKYCRYREGMKAVLHRTLRWALRIAGRVVLTIVLLWLAGLLLYRWIDPPGTPLMVLRLFEGAGWDYQPVALAQTTPHLAQAVIASEDNLFCQHSGIDFGALKQAIDDYQDGEPLRGASTVTMQVARNLFLWTGGGFVRKGLEAPLALAVDAAWPKRRIMTLYLQIAEWGPGIYGAEAAAWAHFNKSANRLSRREAALLAAVLPNPRRWSAGKPTAYIQRRASSIERRMAQLGPELLSCIDDS
jgi:monofunctional glycosyltransferase